MGKAITVETASDDWGTVIQGIYAAKKGDVLVIKCSDDDPAVWGEMASSTAQKRGVVGTVIHVCINELCKNTSNCICTVCRFCSTHNNDFTGTWKFKGLPEVLGNHRICIFTQSHYKESCIEPGHIYTHIITQGLWYSQTSRYSYVIPGCSTSTNNHKYFVFCCHLL